MSRSARRRRRGMLGNHPRLARAGAANRGSFPPGGQHPRLARSGAANRRSLPRAALAAAVLGGRGLRLARSQIRGLDRRMAVPVERKGPSRRSGPPRTTTRPPRRRGRARPRRAPRTGGSAASGGSRHGPGRHRRTGRRPGRRGPRRRPAGGRAGDVLGAPERLARAPDGRSSSGPLEPVGVERPQADARLGEGDRQAVVERVARAKPPCVRRSTASASAGMRSTSGSRPDVAEEDPVGVRDRLPAQHDRVRAADGRTAPRGGLAQRRAAARHGRRHVDGNPGEPIPGNSAAIPVRDLALRGRPGLHVSRRSCAPINRVLVGEGHDCPLTLPPARAKVIVGQTATAVLVGDRAVVVVADGEARAALAACGAASARAPRTATPRTGHVRMARARGARMTSICVAAAADRTAKNASTNGPRSRLARVEHLGARAPSRRGRRPRRRAGATSSHSPSQRPRQDERGGERRQRRPRLRPPDPGPRSGSVLKPDVGEQRAPPRRAPADAGRPGPLHAATGAPRPARGRARPPPARRVGQHEHRPGARRARRAATRRGRRRSRGRSRAASRRRRRRGPRSRRSRSRRRPAPPRRSSGRCAAARPRRSRPAARSSR